MKYHEFWRASVFFVVGLSILFFLFIFFFSSVMPVPGLGRFLFSLLQLFASFFSRGLLDAGGFGIYIGSGVIDCCLFQFTCLFEFSSRFTLYSGCLNIFIFSLFFETSWPLAVCTCSFQPVWLGKCGSDYWLVQIMGRIQGGSVATKLK